MRIAKIIGNVTLNRSHPSLTGLSLRLGIPLNLEELQSGADSDAEPLVMVDQLGAAEGSLVAFSESSEAAAPFRPEIKPVDAYVTAILDHLEIDG